MKNLEKYTYLQVAMPKKHYEFLRLYAQESGTSMTQIAIAAIKKLLLEDGYDLY